MTYESVDQLQRTLTEEVFGYARDSKKAAGRALGTIVEIVTFYLLKTWGLDSSISIETKVPEYGRPEITHNVEYSLHPVLEEHIVEVNGKDRSLRSCLKSHQCRPQGSKTTSERWRYPLSARHNSHLWCRSSPDLTLFKQPLTANRLLQLCSPVSDLNLFHRTNNVLLSRNKVLRNGCRIAQNSDCILTATLLEEGDNETFQVSIAKQDKKPYAMFECKRVGVEEGNKKGPQTIEKAKQGAYVARTVSSLQKVRLESGHLYGVIFEEGQILHFSPYHDLLSLVIDSNDIRLLGNFVLTSGVVSNHGNWFTSQSHNKELKVLAQSYDWLIFLTDKGITEFISEVIIDPIPKYSGIRNAFMESYGPEAKKNKFTKVSMRLDAHRQLLDYFSCNIERIENWFEVIAPVEEDLRQLKFLVQTLRNKKWAEIHK